MQDHINMKGRRRTGVFRKRVYIYNCCQFILLHAEGGNPGASWRLREDRVAAVAPLVAVLVAVAVAADELLEPGIRAHGIPHAPARYPTAHASGADARRKLGRCWRV
jgi:hypothetical protein